MYRLLALFFLASMVGCVDLTGPANDPPFAGSYPMTHVPAEYATYWAEVEKCSGLSRPMDVSFYQIDSMRFGPVAGAVSYYQPDADRITLGTFALTTPETIRHEMLHAHGVRGHPVEYRTKCKGIIHGW